MSDVVLDQIESLVRDEFGSDYAAAGPRRYKARSRAHGQDVHEAIRPGDVTRTPVRLAPALDRDALRLYTLVWQRTVASQMADAGFTEAFILLEGRNDAQGYWLTASTRATAFDGYRRLWPESHEGAGAQTPLPNLEAGQQVRLLDVSIQQVITQPPVRYSEASFLREVDQLGIDPMLQLGGSLPQILDLGFVELDGAQLRPTSFGFDLVDRQREYFPGVFDVEFMCRVNDAIAEVAEGTLSEDQALDVVWAALDHSAEQLSQRTQDSLEDSAEEQHDGDLDELCPLCPQEDREPGRLQVKLGRSGKFIGCPNYPDCRYFRNMDGSERAEPDSRASRPALRENLNAQNEPGVPGQEASGGRWTWNRSVGIDLSREIGAERRREIYRRAAARCDEASDGVIQVTCQTHGSVARINVTEMPAHLAALEVEDQRRFLLARTAHTAALVESDIDGAPASALLNDDPQKDLASLYTEAGSWLDRRLLRASGPPGLEIPEDVVRWWAKNRGWVDVVCEMHGVLASIDASRDPRLLGIAWDVAVTEIHARHQLDWVHSFDEPEYEGADCWPRIFRAESVGDDDLLKVLTLGLHFEGPWPWWSFRLLG